MVYSQSRDPFVLDNNELRLLASDRIVRRGIAYFKENRVSELRSDHDRLRAFVQGSPDHPYYVEIDIDSDGELCVDCSCPFEWEPACKHAIAVLLAHAAGQPLSQKVVQGAADKAIEKRIKRGQTEVAVTHKDGDRWFGTWEARSTYQNNPRQKTYLVQIRSVSERINYCNCPDLSANLLGTCKHIEAVLHTLKKKAPTKFKKYADKAPPIPLIYLSWEGPESPAIRLKRPLKISDELLTIINRYFDPTGAFQAELPKAFYELEQELGQRTDVHLGDDARAHAQRLRERASRTSRERHIRDEIRSQDGHIPGLSAKLYPYQVEGVAFLASRKRALLADDMGLGKTLQAIAASHWLMKNEKVQRVLVVCPASLKQQWSREIERFLGLKSQIIQGSAKERAAQYQCQNPFSIINYELVVRDKATITRSLSPDILIIDEAQRIRNWRTKTAEAIKSVHSHYAFVLTGTPLENRLEDLYSVMQVVDHGVLGPLWRYLIDFHVTDDRGRVLGYRNLSELRSRLAHVMLRRDRRLVKDQLPDRIEHRRDVELSKKQKEYHDQAVASIGMYADIRRRRALTPAEHKRLLAAIQNARMACNAAGLVDKDSHGSPKLDELKRLLEEICIESSQKVVVFSEWERMTAMAEKITKSLGLDSVRLYGRVPSKDRGKLIEKFQNNPSVKVFISTDAGGVGLNLQAGSVLINLDVPWNPAVLAQRIARVHRLGQKATVQIIHLYSIDSYEERVAAVMNKKRELFDNVIDVDASEDVVGLSKQMADSLIDDVLGIESEPQLTEAPEAPTESPGSEAPAAHEAPQESVDITESDDDELSPYIEKIQRGLGSRLQQILKVGEKLIAVVDRMDHRAERLSNAPQEGPLSILVVDQKTASTLDKMGTDSPFGGKEEVFEKAPRPAPRNARAPALIAAAKRQLKAAQMLIESERGKDSLHFITEALLMSCASKLGFGKAPKVDEAALWIFNKVAKNLDDESKVQVSRALTLSHCTELPSSLINELFEDAKAFVDQAAKAV